MNADPAKSARIVARSRCSRRHEPDRVARPIRCLPLEALEPPAAPPAEAIPPDDLSSFTRVEYPEEPPPTFALDELLAWISLVSLAFGGLCFLPPRYFAGACGLVTLAWLLLISVLKPEGRFFFVIWWALLATYITACAIAIIHG